MNLNNYFEKYKDYGPIFIRLIIGFHLIYGTQDNVFSWERMLEFRDFLESRDVIFPLFAAHVSVYAQFICGILFIVGGFIRYAAVVMIINFLSAIYIVHIGDTYPSMFPALMMLSGSIYFLISGAGKLSIDYYLQNKKTVQN